MNNPVDITTATVTLVSASAYSQSRKHDEPKLNRESADAYELRTWKNRMHVRTLDAGLKTEHKTVVIKGVAMTYALASAAKRMGLQVPGKGKSTYTKYFEAGLMLEHDIDLNIDPDSCHRQAINAHADGVRGSGKRVTRYYPTFDSWTATFEMLILDEVITEDVFRATMVAAGMFIGIGQFRPENQGSNGRFKLADLVWHDGRALQPRKNAA